MGMSRDAEIHSGCCWATGAGLVGAQWGHFLSFGFRVQS